MRSEGKVISIDGKYAVVATERRAACEGCHKRSEDGTCSVCTLLGGESRLDTRALNSAGAAVGDTVALESSSGRMLGYAALVFILPCLLAIAAYFVFSHVTGKTVLVVTHEQNLVDTLGQRVINISHGNVIGDRTIGQHETPSIG